MIRFNSTHRQHLERQMVAMKYGKTKSKTLANMVKPTYDAELV